MPYLCAILLFAAAMPVHAQSGQTVDRYPYLLWARTDGAVSLWTIHQTNGPNGASAAIQSVQDYGPFQGWEAVSIASHATTDPSTNATYYLWYVMWRNDVDGRLSLWTVDSRSPQQISYDDYGPFDGWTAFSMSAGADGHPRVLWVHQSGWISLWTVTGHGTVAWQNFPPPVGFEQATSLDSGGDGKTRILWSGWKGMEIWTINSTGAVSTDDYPPMQGWAPISVRVGPTDTSGTERVLWKNNNGAISIWTITSPGHYTHDDYGPYGGWQPFAMIEEDVPMVIWLSGSGQISLWTIDQPGHFFWWDFGPYNLWLPETFAAGAVATH